MLQKLIPLFALTAFLPLLKAERVVEAYYTPLMLNLDGKLDETVWQKAPRYTLGYSADREGEPVESTTVQVAWHPQGVYVAFRCEDSAIVQYNLQDEQHHYRSGDMVEVFLKAANDSYYWEMYATPAGNKTTMFFFRSAQGKLFSDPLHGHDFKDLQIGVAVDGTLNNPDDVDTGWTAEFFIPRSFMKYFEKPGSPEEEWRIMTSRYNFGHKLEKPELSMYPKLSKTRFHLTEEYAFLKFVRPEATEATGNNK